MIQIIPSEKRQYNDFGWLKTYWLFSFSDYYDPGNIQFGPLRVFNDDVVERDTGFDTHPHSEMEIITIVLEGDITHKDSMGNQTVIRTGEVQRMTAGTGLTHSEFNRGDRPVHFYQIWIHPQTPELPPSYDQKHFGSSLWRNRLLPVASGQSKPDAVTFHADASIYRADLEQGRSLDFLTEDGRNLFVYVSSGALEINGKKIETGDQARTDDETKLVIHADKNSSFILIDLPY